MELFSAVKSNDISKVKELIENGTDPNTQDNNGNTPLHYSAIYGNTHGNIEISKLLLENGAIPNIKNNKDKTPLELIRDPETKKEIENYIIELTLLKRKALNKLFKEQVPHQRTDPRLISYIISNYF